ncbi:hypothetical protein RN001_002903 [Aquatica leii]|uniref:Non-specific serine/threonine protein kinase n=1 Tax=Aquatica leii TaxID=1421715 RepID=A0AAN7PHI5_9COLE|nr:hypothetical protein RN001_002903 [Aquatica leii]
MNIEIDKITMENIVKEGWIWKKGEHLRNWRLRYYILLENGQFLGYKKNPNDHFVKSPLNCFNVKKCEILEMNGNKQFIFVLKCFQQNSQVERIFSLSNENDRKEWIHALQRISQNKLITFEQQSNKVTLQNFEYIQVLGRGTFGKVMLCREKSSQQLFAIKLVKKEIIRSKQQLNRTLTENRILKRINHPFLISLKYSFQTPNHLCFVMDYINGGELFFHLRRFTKFTEEKARFYTAEIVSALSYLHDLSIIYRDVKSENILLDKDGHIKLVDFGLCREKLHCGHKSKSFCGTPEYMAPEVIRRIGYGREVDWWSTGVFLYEMLCGVLPFFHNNYNNLFSLILLQHPKIPKYISAEAKDLLKGLLRKNPQHRLGFGSTGTQNIKNHPFFNPINWFDLDKKKVVPPFVPQIDNEEDTKYFDLVVACESTSFTPPLHSPLGKEDDEMLFGRFSFKDKRE